ncbi:Hypothetical predicted protein [Xyrichtys novacula]|uniref:Uncharacterized protein n=1 Tax=Xyrichtys novacula TaxID=13765 RepID=A0AAV1EXQ0_XYRNO|nr:Hypothetical predicted protein [Xyrichtys novacula]
MSCQTVIIPINLFTVLWLQNVPVPEAEVVEEKAVYNDLRNKVNFTSRALRNMERYLVFSTPNALSTTLLARECLALNLSWAPSWRRVQLVHVHRAAPEDPQIVHGARETDVHIQEASFVDHNGLKLDRVEQFSVKKVCSKLFRGHNTDMTSVDASCHFAESWVTSQLLEPSPNFLQLSPVGQMQESSENLVDVAADTVDHIVARRTRDVEGL